MFAKVLTIFKIGYKINANIFLVESYIRKINELD